MNNEERRQWIQNDEGLYQWWKESRLSLARFIQTNRTEIDRVINRVLGNEQPAHYLAYNHRSGCMCYGCQHQRSNA